MNEANKKSLKEKTKDFLSKNKDSLRFIGGYLAGVAVSALSIVIATKINEHAEYKHGSDFTRYMMDMGYTANESKIWEKSTINYISATEKTLGIPLSEKWDEYKKEHPDEFINW